MSYLKGGKTPPRLLQDLNIYNPDQLPTNGYNVLVELAFPYDEKEKAKPSKTTAKGSCKHQWALKPNACTSQVIDESEPALMVVGAFCTECRRHLSLELDSRGEGPGVKPCPTPENPLHHFCHNSKRSEGFQRTNGGLESWEDTRLFQCSAQACSTRLTVRMRSPRLKKSFRDLLLDRKLIEERARKAMASDPERFEGHAVPPPLTVMSNLRAYLSNAMKGDVKHIQKTNKKWLLSLGEPCIDLLSYLQFSLDDMGWDPPRPEVTDTAPFSTDLKVLLDDVDSELQVLMSKQPDEEKRQLKLHFGFTPAAKEIRTLLGCDDYKRSLASRTANQSEDDEHPFYGGLGAVLDFHDSLIEFAYSRQSYCDPKNDSYYLQCLKGIAEGRGSEELSVKAALETSAGKVSMSDIQKAYADFGLDMRSLYLDDDHIIGNFRSRISDAPKQEDTLRQSLTIIGQHRNSSKIEDCARDTITTYDQALSWLGANAEMDDSFIVSMYGVKIGENETNGKTARECVEMIAKFRNSMPLRSFLATGDLVETEMDSGQAYARLDIGDRTVDDDLILSAYDLAVQDQPSQEAELKRALTAIAKDRNSTTLRNYLNTSSTKDDHKLSEWPVGLDNIGNTCYLNSLLQFYFTIKPLRELVLNFDDYKVDFETSAFEKKQVGSRNVSKREVERAQKFVLKLQKLFNSMISANATDVKPEIELARLTLLSSSTEDTFRRRSTLKTQRPSLGEIEGKPVHGPQPAIISEDIAREREDSVTVMGDDAQTVQTSTNTLAGEEDMSSDSTLVEKSSPMVLDYQEVEQQAKALENKENMAPTKQETEQPSPPESPLKPLANAAPTRINEQPGMQTLDPNKSKDEGAMLPITIDYTQALPPPPPPTRSPPPVPPRNKPLDRHEEIKKEVEFGAQQDVTEVISNVLFQLQCAIKPESIDQSGEQIDRIKKLFFGKQKVTTTAKDGKARTKEEFFSDIKVQVSSGPRDIYAALDGAFDEQIVEVGTSKEPQFTSISLLPPILQLHVSRAQYNRVNKEFFKATHHLEIKETIFMDRYMDSDDEDLQRRRAECWAWKKELAQLEKREAYLRKTELEISMPEALEHTVTYLNQLLEDKDSPEAIGVPEDLPQKIAAAAEATKKELIDLESRIKDMTTNINSQFTDLRTLPYRLHSVIIHRGVVSSGHYWIYIYDFARKIWRQYNDDRVEEVADLSKIYQRDADEHRPATSSFLVYVKEGLELDLTEAVCRQIDENEILAGSSAAMPIQIDGATDVQMLEGRSDSPMAKLSRWPTDLQSYSHQEDVEMKDAREDIPAKPASTREKFKGLIRPPQILGHKNITW